MFIFAPNPFNMSISVQQLTKIYGAQRAIDAISFEAHKGQVLGFLGPNGAGKTTTMKILTCYLPQTSGSAAVCGLDVATQSLEVRRLVGYLPEHNPLYKEMYVREYLEFVAGVHRLAHKRRKVEEVIERVGLVPERHKPILALSRGYRQRVGLAQAILHDPEVLILDEPTSGLDPNQIQEIRQLIKEFGREKTVIFSTHILQEVQAICDRVLIINKGVIVADDSMETLQQKVSNDWVICVTFAGRVAPKFLETLPYLNKIVAMEAQKFTIFAKKDIRAEIFNWAVAHQQVLIELKLETHSMEEIFHALTHAER